MIQKTSGPKYYLFASLKTILIFMAVLLFFNFSFSGPNDLSEGEKRSHIESEIQRHKSSVLEMALVLFENFPEEFPFLNKLPREIALQILSQYIEMHDAPKLWPMWKLRLLGFKGSVVPFDNIVINWEKPLTEAERGWVNELNEVEGVYKTSRLITICHDLKVILTDGLWRELLLIEDTADIFDTKLNRLREVNGQKTPPKPFAAEEFLRFVRKDEIGARLIRRFEIFWPHRPRICPALFK